MNLKNISILLILIFAFSSCDDEEGGSTPTVTFPKVSIADLEVQESDEDKDVTVQVNLDKAGEANVILNYSTIAQTAESSFDFVALANEQIIIPAGQTSGAITVRIRGDQTEEPSETFEILLINPSNATLEKDRGIITILDDDDPSANVLVIPQTGYSTPESYDGMSLVWQDEFVGTSLNEADWTYEIGTGNGGWGNNELQYYRSENTSIAENNYLVIEAKSEAFASSDYTSSRIVTQGKQEFQYGRIDIRAALPEGRGLWPALWMLGSNFSTSGWPMCGEIDIMELVGHAPNRTHSTVHYGESFPAHQFRGSSIALNAGAKFSEEFHVFSLIWEENSIQFLMDDMEVFNVVPETLDGQPYPFNQPFFFIFNVAVGGEWPGDPDSGTSFPQRMIVDYVRVFQ